MEAVVSGTVFVRDLGGEPAFLVADTGSTSGWIVRVRVGGQERSMTLLAWNALPAWEGPLPPVAKGRGA